MSVNLDKDLVLLTAAGGKQVTNLLPFLKFKNLRLVVHSQTSADRLKAIHPNAEVIRTDLTEPRECKRVLKGVTAIYHIGPSFHPHETAIGHNMIDAAIEEAKSGTFKHFVYSSVLNTQLRKLMNHDGKRYVEEHLMESGLNWTILQPSHFMDMFPLPMLMASPEPVYPAGWDPSKPFGYTSAKDAGEAGAKVLQERQEHYFAQYPLVSTKVPIGYAEVCKIASKMIGKEIKVEQKPLLEAAARLTNSIVGGDEVPDATRDAAQRMLLYYEYYGLKGNSNVMKWLLGREPTTWEAWIEDKMKQVK